MADKWTFASSFCIRSLKDLKDSLNTRLRGHTAPSWEPHGHEVPVSCRTFAIRSPVFDMTSGMSFILSELRFPRLQNGYPDTDFCSLLELNENMCRARGSENHSSSTWTAKRRRVWKVSREPGSSPISARGCLPLPQALFFLPVEWGG